MGTFQSSDEVYKILGCFLGELTQEPDIRPAFVSTNTSMLIAFTSPDARILLDCRSDPPTVVTDPPEGTSAEVSLTMSADDGHQFWLGKYNVAMGLAKRHVKVSGSLGTMMKLLPALQPAFSRYQDFLARNGHDGML